ncbi:MAG TPA: transcription antitermination factor NusB [Candidatus Binatia bacterium]|nr:transcription antitermination factor NusB [Candidatus Binatia bacterium]
MDRDSIPLSRRGLARRLTVQAIYQWLVNETPPEKLMRQFHEDPGLGRADRDYFHGLLHGVVREAGLLTDTFEEYLDRALEQLDPVERAVLLLGSYELMFRPEVPWKVVVNESVNLTKMFGAEESFKYINAVLDKVARTVRAVEVAGGTPGAPPA